MTSWPVHRVLFSIDPAVVASPVLLAHALELIYPKTSRPFPTVGALRMSLNSRARAHDHGVIFTREDGFLRVTHATRVCEAAA